MAVKKLVRVTIDVELEKDVTDLLDLVANRAHTIQGVANAYSVKLEEIIESTDTWAEAAKAKLEAEKAKHTWLAALVKKVKGWFGRGD